MQISVLAHHELEAARSLLEANALPTDDLADSAITLFAARDDGQLVGVIGLQRCEPVALLRSLAVAPTARDRGIGALLCEHVFGVAREQQLGDVYLLTTSARAYFVRHGFVAIDRASAPASIRSTAQFASLCPSSATVMYRRAESCEDADS